MAIKIKELLAARDALSVGLGISKDDAAGIVGKHHEDADTIAAFIAGDFSAAGVGVNTPTAADDRQALKNPGTITAEKNFSPKLAAGSHGRKVAEKKKREREDNPAGDVVPTVAGDIVTDCDGLPEGLADNIIQTLKAFCNEWNIDDLSKARQAQWGAACKYIGASIFRDKSILNNKEEARRRGVGVVYDVGRLSALCDLFSYLCGVYVKAFTIDDFAHFCGVSDSWLYGAGRDNLTPARASLLQKIQRLQESGLSGLIVDGRQNPTGALAALNHWHGWTQTREVIHTAGNAAPAPSALPVFDNKGGFLTDNGGN